MKRILNQSFANFASVTLVVAAALASALTSCSSSSDEPKDLLEITSPKSILIVDRGGKTTVETSTVTSKVTFDNVAMTASVQLPTQLGGAQIPGLKWSNTTVDGYKARVVANGSATTSDGVAARNVYVTYLEDTKIADTECMGLLMKCDLGSDVKALIAPAVTMCAAKTATTNTTDNSVFSSDRTSYVITIDPATSKGGLVVKKAAFADKMPELGDMHFDGLDFTPTASGYKLDCESLTPTIDGVEYRRYQITDLHLVADVFGSLTLTFRCMGIFRVDASLSPAFSPVN